MSKQKAAQPHYIVSIHDEPDAPGVFRFTFVPKGAQQARTAGEPPKPVPEYIVSVRRQGEESAFTWVKSPQQESTKAALEKIARDRVTQRADWIQRVRTS